VIIGQEGPAVVIDARTAAWMLKYADISRLRVRVRGIDPRISRALEEITVVGLEWRTSATGTPVAAKPEPATNSEQWLSTGQAADLVGVTCRAIRKAIAEARLPATQVGGRYRISREDLEHYRTARRERASA
jgi:excisionase family DNA binding protein